MKRLRLGIAFVVLWLGLLARGAWSAPAKKIPASASASASVSASASSTTGPKPLYETLTGDAKTDFDQGGFAYKNGDYAGALVKLRSAFELSKDPRILWNMALCEQKLRHYAEATRLFHRYLDEGGALVTDEDRESAKKKMEETEPFTSSLVFTIDQPDAEVFVDDVSIGKSPLPSGDLVDVGNRKIVVKKSGFSDWKQDVFVDGSKRELPIDVKMVVEKHEGKVTIRAPAGAEIFIDDVRVGVGEWTGVLPSKGHTLRVTAPGMRVYQTEIVIQDGDVRTIPVPLEPEVEVGETYDRFEADLRAGYGKLTGNGSPAIDSIGGSIGVRLGRPTWLGLSFGYGRIDSSTGTCGRQMDGPAPTGPIDLTVRSSFRSCNVARGDALLMVHFQPRSMLDPWVGASFGVLYNWGSARTFDPATSVTFATSGQGIAFLIGAQLGLDVHPLERFQRWAVGPFFVYEFSVHGDYGMDGNGNPAVGNNPAVRDALDAADSQKRGDKRAFAHFLFGLRTAISF